MLFNRNYSKAQNQAKSSQLSLAVTVFEAVKPKQFRTYNYAKPTDGKEIDLWNHEIFYQRDRDDKKAEKDYIKLVKDTMPPRKPMPSFVTKYEATMCDHIGLFYKCVPEVKNLLYTAQLTITTPRTEPSQHIAGITRTPVTIKWRVYTDKPTDIDMMVERVRDRDMFDKMFPISYCNLDAQIEEFGFFTCAARITDTVVEGPLRWRISRNTVGLYRSHEAEFPSGGKGASPEPVADITLQHSFIHKRLIGARIRLPSRPNPVIDNEIVLSLLLLTNIRFECFKEEPNCGFCRELPRRLIDFLQIPEAEPLEDWRL